MKENAVESMAMPTKATQESNHQNDGVLRIHRRRAGAYQPKDSLGLACIMQEGNIEENNQLMRRRSLAAPPDNIGISCLPTKDRDSAKKNLEAAEPENPSDVTFKSHHLSERELSILSELKNLKINPVDQGFNIGMSNIKRPKNAMKPRKPILPKNNIGFCCQLLQKPTISNTSIRSIEKKILDNTSEKNSKIKKTQSEPKLKEKEKPAVNKKMNNSSIRKNLGSKKITNDEKR